LQTNYVLLHQAAQKNTAEIMELQKQDFSQLMTIGKAFAESGMFTDTKTAAQAVVKIQAGAEMGIPPFASMSGIHIIQGKPTVGAGLLAARIQGSGKYKYRVKEHTEKTCSIEFFEGGESLGVSTFTIEDAKKAQTKNLDKFPRNMLFARALSNGVKWYTPDLFAGPVYVPGEIPSDEVEDIAHEVIPDTADALNVLALCQSVEELTEWKQTFGAVLTPEVKAAAKAKHLELTAKTKEV
jgi:hypothetical protein